MPEFEADVTVTATVEFEVFCGRCGAGLCGNSRTGSTARRGRLYVEVDPCEACLKNEFECGAESARD